MLQSGCTGIILVLTRATFAVTVGEKLSRDQRMSNCCERHTLKREAQKYEVRGHSLRLSLPAPVLMLGGIRRDHRSTVHFLVMSSLDFRKAAIGLLGYPKLN